MTDAEFELELVEALNMLLEDERASVEMEVALASGATEYGERESLAGMGAEDIRFCVQLREEMEQAGLPVTPQINGVVFEVIGSERYDDRLRAFAHHQRVVADRARELQESNLEGGLRDALDGISVSHDLHAEWVERHAAEFAATRTLEFGIGARARAAAAEEAAANEQPEQFDDQAPLAPVAPDEAVEVVEVVEPAEEPEEPDASSAPEEPAAQEPLAVVEVPVVEPAPAEEPAAPPKPRARATTRSTAAKGAAKPGATRAKATPKKTSTTTPKPRARRPKPSAPPDEA